jgi:tetratricopeptide (TPR) repeat protein
VLRAGIAALVLGACVAVVVYGLTRPKAPEVSPPIGARLELAAGDVTVDQDGAGDGEPAKASGGTALRVGASVHAGEGARALVRLPDGSTMFLRADSSVTLAADAVTLGGGEYWLDVPALERDPQPHRIGEIAVTAAEAGLSLRKTDSGAVVYVARGMAVVTGKGGRVEVKAGEQASVEGDAAPAVSAVAFWDDWTGGMADFAGQAMALGPGTGTIYGVDVGAAPGTPAEPLQLKRQSVRAVVRDGLSETEVDQTFFNPSSRPVEGWYWFVIPEGASVTGFALETDGTLVEGEFIEKREAATKYAAAKQTGHSPAILEWVDGKSYRARIFPIPATGSRRVVLRYLELKPVIDGKLSYVYPMGRGTPTRIGEFSLSADLGDAGTTMAIATLDEARIEGGGRTVTMRRSGYTPRADFQLEATLKQARKPLVVSRFATGGDAADYIMARYTPEVDWSTAAVGQADVVVVVDTSADGDEATRQLRAATAEAVLRALSDKDRFALISLDVRPTVLHPEKELAAAGDKDITRALERLAEHASGGATDLAAMFDAALGRVHGAEQPAVIYIGDGVATSGELSGEQLIERLRRGLSTSRARLFTVAVGPGADDALLSELARAGGGSSFRVEGAGEATEQALELVAAVKVPSITDFELDLGAGLDEPLSNVSGKVARGSDVLLLARTHHDTPKVAKVRGRLGGKAFEQEVEVAKDDSVIGAFVPRLWAASYVRRLLGGAGGAEAERGRIVSLGVEYGLVTPFSSILALESEAAYSRMGIPRRPSPLRGVKLSALDARAERQLASSLAAVPPHTAFGCAKDEPSSQAARDEREVDAVPASPPAFATASPAAPDNGMDAPKPEAQAGAAEAPRDPDGKDDGALEEDKSAVPGLSKVGEGGGGRAAPTTATVPTEPAASASAAPPTPIPPPAPVASRPEPAANERDQLAQKKPDTSGWRGPPVALGTCSDVARRPLAQRLLIWKKRLATAREPQELLARHRAALEACEIADWHAEREFLRLMQRNVDSEAAARIVLGHFAGRPDVQKFVAGLILRRVVDERIIAAVETTLFGGQVDWAAIDRQLSEIEEVDARIAKLRETMARAPDDPNGKIRLVSLLSEAGKAQEALSLGRRLRDDGLLTLPILRQLGDVLARQKLDAEAVRTYSEIVEFDPASAGSRLLLGDIYLGRGWYESAYRQYKTVADGDPNDAMAWLRLAAAAAGDRRIDEALRIERRVAEAQGRPGPNDPRRWARLWSAARVARLIAEPPKERPPSRESLERKLKELGLFGQSPGVLVMLTWEKLRSDALLVTRVDEEAVMLGEPSDAAPVGMSAVLLSPQDRERVALEARLRSVPEAEKLPLVLQEIRWDGRKFTVRLERRELEPRQTGVVL